MKADSEWPGNTAQVDGRLPPATYTGGLGTPHYGLSSVLVMDGRPQGSGAQARVTYRLHYKYFMSMAAAGEIKSYHSVHDNTNV